MQSSRLLAIEQDRMGVDVAVHYTECIGFSPALPFFLRNFAELIEAGHAHPLIAGSNRSKAVWACAGEQVIGVIVFDILDDTVKTAWKNLSCVDAGWRGRGIFKILHSHFEAAAIRLGSKIVASNVHVDNLTHQTVVQTVGCVPSFIRMEKKL